MDNVAICAIGLLLFCGSLVTMHGEEGSDLMLRFHSEVYAATFEDISRKSYKEHMVFTVGVNKANELAHEFVLANKEEMIEWRNRHQLSSEAYNLTQQYITDRKTEKVELEGLTIDGMSDPEKYHTAWSPLFTSHGIVSQILYQIYGTDKSGQLNNETMVAMSLMEDSAHIVSKADENAIKSLALVGAHAVYLEYQLIDKVWLDLTELEVFKLALGEKGIQVPADDP